MPSTSAKQSRFMQAIANNPSFAKKVGVKQSVGKDFAAADKGKTFARGGVTQQKINKQNTRHGMMDLPVANLSRFAGMKKGGVMGKVKRYNGETEDGSEVYSDRDENPEAQEVERRTFPTGVRMSPDYLTKSTPAPRKAAAKPVAAEDSDAPMGGIERAAYRRMQVKENTLNKNTQKDNWGDEDRALIEAAKEKYKSWFNPDDVAAMNKETAANEKLISDERASRTNARQKAAAKASDDGKDYSSNILNNAGDVAGVVGNTALAGAALMGGNTPAARIAASRVAAPAGRLFTKVKDALRQSPIKEVKDGSLQRAESQARTLALEKSKAARAARARLGIPQRGKLQEGGKITGFKKGGMMKESKGMMAKEMRFMKKKGAPASMIKHEKAEMGMGKGGMPMKDGKPAFMKKFAKGGGIESRGKTKGTVIRMASGGSVSSASRRADGIAQRGKTRC